MMKICMLYSLFYLSKLAESNIKILSLAFHLKNANIVIEWKVSIKVQTKKYPQTQIQQY